MKRILSVLLAAVLSFSIMATGSLAAPAPSLGISGTKASAAMNAVTASNIANNKQFNIGDTFSLTFPKECFVWGSGTATLYNAANFNNAWVYVNNASLTDGNFELVAASTVRNATTGSVTVTFKAKNTYSGPVNVYLHGGVGTGAGATNTWTVTNISVTNTPFTSSGVAAGAGAASSTVASAINVGDTFTVEFSKQSLKWSPAGNGTYQFSGFLDSWVKMAGADLGTTGDFTLTGVAKNTANGKVTATFKANRAYAGTITVNLNDGSAVSNSFSKYITVNDTSAPSTITKTKGGTAPAMTSHSGSSVTLNTGDSITFKIPADNFEWSSASGTKDATKLIDKSWVKLSGANIGTDFSVDYVTPTGSTGEVQVKLTALKGNTYNNLKVYLQGGGGGATASSPNVNVTVNSTTSGKITGIASGATLGGTHSGALLNGSAISYSDLGGLEVKPEDELLLPVYAGFFTWDGTVPYAGSNVTTSQISSGKIKLGSNKKKGNAVFEEIDLVNRSGIAYVRVKFKEDYTSTKDVDFEANLYFTVNGSRHTDSQVTIAGVYAKETTQVWEDDDYFDLSGGEVLDVEKYVRNVELYLGNGVTMYANLSSGRKYSGVALMEPDSSDEKILDDYDSIEYVIKLKTNGLNKSGNKVTFDYDENYYVYGADGKYLGRSNDKLPYSDKYYLSTKKIGSSIADEEVLPPQGGDDLPPPPTYDDGSGNDGVGGDNGGVGGIGGQYDNPYTGDGSAPIVAIVFMGVSLAAAGAALGARKKKKAQ